MNEKKPRGKFKHNTLKSFKDIPMGTPMSSESHPVNNLAARGAIPLGQSGEPVNAPSNMQFEGGATGQGTGGV